MKLTTFILITVILQVSANTFAQKITLSEKNSSLVKVFDKISDQSGYDFLVSSEMLRNAKPVNIEVSNLELKEVLKKIFEEQPLDYDVQEKMVVVSRKSPTFLERLVDRWAAIDVTGRVVDEKGIPLPGATVKAKGAKSVITDIKGRFMLENVEEGAIVTISYTGYVTLEMSAKQSMGTIALKLSENPLDQVQIIAYGTQTKRYSLGNVVSVKAADIEKQPVQNPLLALQGRVAGLEITQANGMNGSGVKVRVQGQNSIRNGSDPLIIIDGMPYPSQTLKTTSVGAGLLGYSADLLTLSPESSRGGAGSTLNYINPSDIESIEVLKDADATAIYGSRAASGAILITTKKGRAGETQLDFNLQQGWGSVRKFIDVLTTQQYLEMRREAFKNDGLPIPSIITSPNNTDFDLNGHWDANRQTDWQKELIGGTANYRDAILTLSGGNNTTNFRLSGTYNRRGTVFPGRENGNPSGNLHFSISNISANQKFRAQFSGSFMSNVNRLPGLDLTQTAIQRAPNAPALYNADGSLNWAPTAAGKSSIRNPLATLETKYKSKTSNMVSSLSLGYKILPDFEIIANLGYNNQQLNEFLGIPLSSYRPEQQITDNPSELRYSNYSSSDRNSWNMEPQITYKRAIDSHYFDVLIGGTVQQNYGNGIAMIGYGYSNDISMESPNAAARIDIENSVIPTYKYVGAFARLTYRLKERYLVNVTMRRDGSSRFGPGSRFHNFGSVAGGWIFTEEKLIKHNLPFLSFGKLRVSFGTSGNDQLEDYLYMSLVDVSPAPAYQGTVGYSVSRLANAYLEWEEKKSLQMGVDLGFFNERIFLTANYVRNRTSNQLLPYNLPSIAGYPVIESNFPATMQNKGIEMELKTVNIKTQSFQWNTSMNISILRNSLFEFPNIENTTYARYLIVGKPHNILRNRYHLIGINPANGLYQVMGKDGPTSVGAEGLRDMIVDPNPKYSGGIQNSINYKKLQFDFFFSFSKKIAPPVLSSVYPGNFNSGNGNQPVSVLNRWQKSGDIAEYQKFSQGRSFTATRDLWYSSDHFYVDGSFVSLKNVSLSYFLPSQWVQKISLKSARIYTRAQNLWTYSEYKGFDPESTGTGLPPLRIITFGIQASL